MLSHGERDSGTDKSFKTVDQELVLHIAGNIIKYG